MSWTWAWARGWCHMRLVRWAWAIASSSKKVIKLLYYRDWALLKRRVCWGKFRQLTYCSISLQFVFFYRLFSVLPIIHSLGLCVHCISTYFITVNVCFSTVFISGNFIAICFKRTRLQFFYFFLLLYYRLLIYSF